MSEIIIADHRGRLSRLSDVILAALADGEVLTYEAATLKWKNKVAAGGTLSITQRRDAGIQPSYTIYESGGNYYGKSHRVGLADYGPEADAYTVFDAVDAAMNGIYGAKAFVESGVFTFGSTWRPRDFNRWEGEAWGFDAAYNPMGTTLRPANVGVTPLISFDRGGIHADNRMQKVFMDNIRFDMRDYADSEIMHLHNIKDSHFTNLWFTNWKKNAVVLAGTATQNILTYWDGILSTADPNTDHKAVFLFDSNSSDHWINNVYAQFNPANKTGVGVYIHHGAAIWIENFHANLHDTLLWIDATAECGGISLRNFHSDTPSSHSIIIDANGTGAGGVWIDSGWFYAHLANMDLIRFEGAGGGWIERCAITHNRSAGIAGGYCVNNQHAGNFTGNLFQGNRWSPQNLGSYLNVPPEMVRDDYAWIKDCTDKSGGTNTELSAASTEYVATADVDSPNADESVETMIVRCAGVFAYGRAYVTAAPGAVGKTRTFALRVNGVTSALTMTITNAETTATDVIHWITVAAGDRICWISTVANTPAASKVKLAVAFYPTGSTV